MIKQKVLFFSPHSAIWSHAFSEALIAETLMQQGHEVQYVTCGKLLNNFCIPMSAFGLTEAAFVDAKERVCKTCIQYKALLKKNFSFNGFDLHERLSSDIILKVELLLKTVTVDNFLDFIIDDIPIGKLSTYEFFINHKIISTVLSEEKFRLYKVYLKNSLMVYFIMDQYIKETNPTRVVCYNNLYSVNGVVCGVAKKNDIPYFSIHSGVNWARPMETLFVSRNFTKDFLDEAKVFWENYKSYPCTKTEITNIRKYMLSLSRQGSVFVYSPKKNKNFFDVRKFFHIDEHRKILVATMSSCDERFAGELVGLFTKQSNNIFSDQVEWIKFLIDNVKKRDDLFLIVRVHPREFPNAREQIVSDHTLQLKQIFQDLPKNVAINWPTQNISLYDLADVAKVFLNAWSSAGVEMAALGLPVVIYASDLICAPRDLFYVPNSLDDYMNKVDLAIQEGWQYEKIRLTYRWINLSLEKVVFDISDSSVTLQSGKNLFFKIFFKLVCFFDPLYFKKRDCRKRAKILHEGDMISYIISEGKQNIFETDFIKLKYENCVRDVNMETWCINRTLQKLFLTLYRNSRTKKVSMLYRDVMAKIM